VYSDNRYDGFKSERILHIILKAKEGEIMSQYKTIQVQCQVTEKKETWEIIPFVAKGGFGNNTIYSRDQYNCRNMICDLRGTVQCPFEKRFNG
jgi:hypothetical protein